MCEHRRAGRRARRDQATRGHDYARASRGARYNRRTGWYAHRCGVSRCGQIFVPVRPTQEERTWRGLGHD